MFERAIPSYIYEQSNIFGRHFSDILTDINRDLTSLKTCKNGRNTVFAGNRRVAEVLAYPLLFSVQQPLIYSRDQFSAEHALNPGGIGNAPGVEA